MNDRTPVIDATQYPTHDILVFTHPAMQDPLEIHVPSLLECCICNVIPSPRELLTFDCRHSLCQTCLTSLKANASSTYVNCPICRKQHLGNDVKCSHFLSSILDGFPYTMSCGAEVTGDRVRKHVTSCAGCLLEENLLLRGQLVTVVRCNDRLRDDMEIE